MAKKKRDKFVDVTKILLFAKGGNSPCPNLEEQGYSVFYVNDETTSLRDLALGDLNGKAEFVKLIDENEPEIVSLARSISENGYQEPCKLEKLSFGGYKLLDGRKRMIAAMYIACRENSPARVSAEII